MWLKSFFHHPWDKSRLAAILGALVLSVMAVILFFSVAAALFDVRGGFKGPGNFFVQAYGILAFIIPVYLFCAALLLADPRYRPDRIFCLTCSTLPFVTLALGFSWYRRFDELSRSFGFLAQTGKTGISFFVVMMTILEGCLIYLARYLLFFRQGFRAGTVRGKSKSAGWKSSGHTRFLPPPASRAKSSPERGHGVYDENVGRVRAGPGKPERPRGMEKPERVEKPEKPAKMEKQTLGCEDILPHNVQFIRGQGRSLFLYKPKQSQPRQGIHPGRASRFPGDLSLPAPRWQKTAFPDNQYADPVSPAPVPLGDSAPAQGREAEGPDPQPKAPARVVSADVERALEEAKAAEARHSSPPGDNQDDPAEDFDIDPLKSEYPAESSVVERETETPAAVKPRAPDQAGEKAPVQALPEKPAPVRPKKPIGPYQVPVEGILNQYPDGQYWIIDEATREAALILKETLNEFHIEAEVTGIKKGPVITMFEILPAPGVKLSRIVNLQDNIALRLAAQSVRIVAPIPGKHAVGIEVPNPQRSIVSFREIVEGELRRESRKPGKRPEIPVILGKDITGDAVTVDLATMPHLLIAGSTGSGKSVCVNSMILSILYMRPPAECRLIMIDPKIVELKLYNGIPHLLTPVITEPKKAFQALQYCIFEMERRYACLDSVGVRDIKSYNKRIKDRNIAAEHMPYIVVIIDEFADLMATTGKELESTVARLAAMSRAVGIHLVLATQRPSIDVITGLIKANIPSRIAFMVASKMDSRIIIDMVGAEKLLGKGDMLYAGVVDPFPIRMQGAFISEEEVERVVDYIKTLGEPDYIDDEIFFDDDDDEGAAVFSEGEDPLYEKALEIVTQQGKASASYIQRRLKIGYNRAARLVEDMEHHGVVGPAQGSKPRELLRAY